MTEAEFNEVTDQMEIMPKSKVALYRMLMLGERQVNVAEKTGTTAKTLISLVRRFSSKYKELNNIPQSWECVTVRATPAGKEAILSLAQSEQQKMKGDSV